MSTRQGKFILFDVNEFASWLNDQTLKRKVVRIQNHHTFKPKYQQFKGDNHFSLLQGMESYHINTNHWAEIGQNLTVFPDGKVAVCRSLEKIPAGIYRANTYSVCIENLGDFDAGKDQMTQPQREAIVAVNGLLCRKYDLTPSSDSIVYHHWYDPKTGERRDGLGKPKSCPGTAFFGGNTVADAESNFIPLIQAWLNGAPALIPQPSAVLALGTVAAESLNVRSGPGAKCDALDSLPQGTALKCYERQGNWWRIDPARQRWVNSRYVTKG